MKDSEDAQRLIRLKRYESPGDEYFRNFLESFKDRQRAELLRRSSRSILAERVAMWFTETNGSKWAVPVGAAATLAGLGLYFAISGNGEVPLLAPVSAGSSEESSLAKAEASNPAESVITLQLPKAGRRIPSFEEGQSPESNVFLPAGAQGNFREL